MTTQTIPPTLDGGGKPLTEAMAQFMIRTYSNPNEAAEFSRWRMNPRQIAFVPMGVIQKDELLGKMFIGGIPVLAVADMNPTTAELQDRLGEIVCRIGNLKAVE